MAHSADLFEWISSRLLSGELDAEGLKRCKETFASDAGSSALAALRHLAALTMRGSTAVPSDSGKAVLLSIVNAAVQALALDTPGISSAIRIEAQALLKTWHDLLLQCLSTYRIALQHQVAELLPTCMLLDPHFANSVVTQHIEEAHGAEDPEEGPLESRHSTASAAANPLSRSAGIEAIAAAAAAAAPSPASSPTPSSGGNSSSVSAGYSLAAKAFLVPRSPRTATLLAVLRRLLLIQQQQQVSEQGTSDAPTPITTSMGHLIRDRRTARAALVLTLRLVCLQDAAVSRAVAEPLLGAVLEAGVVAATGCGLRLASDSASATPGTPTDPPKAVEVWAAIHASALPIALWVTVAFLPHAARSLTMHRAQALALLQAAVLAADMEQRAHEIPPTTAAPAEAEGSAPVAASSASSSLSSSSSSPPPLPAPGPGALGTWDPLWIGLGGNDASLQPRRLALGPSALLDATNALGRLLGVLFPQDTVTSLRQLAGSRREDHQRVRAVANHMLAPIAVPLLRGLLSPVADDMSDSPSTVFSHLALQASPDLSDSWPQPHTMMHLLGEVMEVSDAAEALGAGFIANPVAVATAWLAGATVLPNSAAWSLSPLQPSPPSVPSPVMTTTTTMPTTAALLGDPIVPQQQQQEHLKPGPERTLGSGAVVAGAVLEAALLADPPSQLVASGPTGLPGLNRNELLPTTSQRLDNQPPVRVRVPQSTSPVVDGRSQSLHGPGLAEAAAVHGQGVDDSLEAEGSPTAASSDASRMEATEQSQMAGRGRSAASGDWSLSPATDPLGSPTATTPSVMGLTLASPRHGGSLVRLADGEYGDDPQHGVHRVVRRSDGSDSGLLSPRDVGSTVAPSSMGSSEASNPRGQASSLLPERRASLDSRPSTIVPQGASSLTAMETGAGTNSGETTLRRAQSIPSVPSAALAGLRVTAADETGRRSSRDRAPEALGASLLAGPGPGPGPGPGLGLGLGSGAMVTSESVESLRRRHRQRQNSQSSLSGSKSHRRVRKASADIASSRVHAPREAWLLTSAGALPTPSMSASAVSLSSMNSAHGAAGTIAGGAGSPPRRRSANRSAAAVGASPSLWPFAVGGMVMAASASPHIAFWPGGTGMISGPGHGTPSLLGAGGAPGFSVLPRAVSGGTIASLLASGLLSISLPAIGGGGPDSAHSAWVSTILSIHEHSRRQFAEQLDAVLTPSVVAHPAQHGVATDGLGRRPPLSGGVAVPTALSMMALSRRWNDEGTFASAETLFLRHLRQMESWRCRQLRHRSAVAESERVAREALEVARRRAERAAASQERAAMRAEAELERLRVVTAQRSQELRERAARSEELRRSSMATSVARATEVTELRRMLDEARARAAAAEAASSKAVAMASDLQDQLDRQRSKLDAVVHEARQLRANLLRSTTSPPSSSGPTPEVLRSLIPHTLLDS